MSTDDPVFAYIRQLWREMLRLDVVDTETSFYELGGDSMLMVEMLVAVTGRFPCELDYEDFLSAPSISHLARLINEAQSGNEDDRRNS